MRTLVAATITAMLFGQASAESTGDALKTFGLIGTWSPDCAKDPKDPLPDSMLTTYPTRYTYSMSLFSVPRVTRVQRVPGNVVITFASEIRSAERVTESKIKYIAIPIRLEQSDAPPQFLKNQSSTEFILEKSGSIICIMDARTSDGKILIENGESIVPNRSGGPPIRVPRQLFEKCLN